MSHMEVLLILCLFSLFIVIVTMSKECLPSPDNPTSIICSEYDYMEKNLSFYLSNFSNISQLTLTRLFLIEMPDLNDYPQITTLYLNNNQIQLVNRNYSSLDCLYLTSNHIYALHETNLRYPKLKYLDLSHNAIEYIVKNFFSSKQFPLLNVLKLTNALRHLNPYIIDDRLISFSSLKYLDEIHMDENNIEEFSCSYKTAHVQWKLPGNLKKFFLGKNKIMTFDEKCFSDIVNLTELDLHDNHLEKFSSINSTLPYLLKIQLHSNLFNSVPSNLLYASKQLIELDLSANQLNLQEIKSKKQYVFPSTLKILYLNSLTTDISCSVFENLNQLEQLYLVQFTSTRLKNCVFKKLSKLTTLDLRYHHMTTFDEQTFRPLLSMNRLEKLDITSAFLHCNSCSLRWLIQFLKNQNRTQVICLDQYGKEIFLNTLDLSPCVSLNIFSTKLITISMIIFGLLFIMLLIYTYQHRKFPFSKFPSIYRMIPLQQYNRIYQNRTENITNDNVMLVT